MKMQYLWQGHTLVSLDGKEKKKVSHGEIIEVPEELVARMRLSEFVSVVGKLKVETSDDGTADVTVKVKKTK